MTSEGGAKKQKIVRDAAYEAHPSTCLRTSQGSIFRMPLIQDSGTNVLEFRVPVGRGPLPVVPMSNSSPA